MKGQKVYNFPASLKQLAECKPIYESLPGWQEDISHIRNFEELPKNTQDYLKRIEKIVEVPIQLVSVGPGRDETIILNNPFA